MPLLTAKHLFNYSGRLGLDFFCIQCLEQSFLSRFSYAKPRALGKKQAGAPLILMYQALGLGLIQQGSINNSNVLYFCIWVQFHKWPTKLSKSIQALVKLSKSSLIFYQFEFYQFPQQPNLAYSLRRNSVMIYEVAYLINISLIALIQPRSIIYSPP